ncbi:unnamed protein product, partial [Meganyctiphanes norvegica]
MAYNVQLPTPTAAPPRGTHCHGPGAPPKKRNSWQDHIIKEKTFSVVWVLGLKKKRPAVEQYFFKIRSAYVFLVGTSLFASNIGAMHFIGMAGAGAAAGIGIGGFEQGAFFLYIMLGWVFVPVYMSSGIYTMPEYLRERFGGQRIRVYFSVLSLILYVFTKISADLYGGAIFIQQALNNASDGGLYLSIMILLAIAAVFTIFGGLSAVMWTDMIQVFFMIIGAFILSGMSITEVGGYNGLVDKFPYATASIRALDIDNSTLCGEPPADYMSMLRSIIPGASDYPWTALLFEQTIGGMTIFFLCTNNTYGDQKLCTNQINFSVSTHALRIYAMHLSFLKWENVLTPMGISVGIMFPDRIGCADPKECKEICNNPKGCTDIAFVELVLERLPAGMRGLMYSVMLAALLSSLTSIFNSSSTIFTIDIWPRIRRMFSKRKSSNTELLIVGKLFVLILVIISVIWIPVIQASGNSRLFDYVNSISSYMAPPVCAVFLLAILWNRTNEPGAFWGLMVGFGIGMFRFIVEFSYSLPACGDGQEDPRPELVKLLIGNVHYLHFSCILWLISGFVTISVSLMTPAIPEDCLYRLTFSTRFSTQVRSKLDKKEEENEAIISNNIKAESMEIKEPQEEISEGCNWLKSICGMSKKENDDIGIVEASAKEEFKTEKQIAKDAADFLKEDPWWKTFVDVNILICSCVALFGWGFFTR